MAFFNQNVELTKRVFVLYGFIMTPCMSDLVA